MLGGLYQRQQALGLDIPDLVVTNDPRTARLLAFAGTRIVIVGPDMPDDPILSMLDDVIVKTRLGLSIVISVDDIEEAVIVGAKFVIDFGLTNVGVLNLENAPLDWDEAAEVVTTFLRGKDVPSVPVKVKVDAIGDIIEVLKLFAEVEQAEVDPLAALFEVPRGSTPIAQKVGDVWVVSDESLVKSVFVLYSPESYVGIENAKEILGKLQNIETEGEGSR